jgi:hypothetical protein
MTKSDALDVPSRTVVLLSDSKGAYGIGINPSDWVRSFICNEHRSVDDEVASVLRETSWLWMGLR